MAMGSGARKAVVWGGSALAGVGLLVASFFAGTVVAENAELEQAGTTTQGQGTEDNESRDLFDEEAEQDTQDEDTEDQDADGQGSDQKDQKDQGEDAEDQDADGGRHHDDGHDHEGHHHDDRGPDEDRESDTEDGSAPA